MVNTPQPIYRPNSTSVCNECSVLLRRTLVAGVSYFENGEIERE